MTGKRRIDRILAQGYLADIESRPIEDVRTMRGDCGAEEALLSYERRLLHGRMDLIRFELDRRAGRQQGSIVDNLATILGEERGPSRGAFPGGDPDLEAFGEPTRRASKLLADDTLANLPNLSDDELEQRLEKLEDAERETSEVRAQLLPVLDALTDEIGRRYASGEADPSDVLSGS
jgi:hypothetical protein